jgi:hypothetical protein
VALWRAHSGCCCTLLPEVAHGVWAWSRPRRAYASRGCWVRWRRRKLQLLRVAATVVVGRHGGLLPRAHAGWRWGQRGSTPFFFDGETGLSPLLSMVVPCTGAYTSPFISGWATSEVTVYGQVKTLLGSSRRWPQRCLRASCPPLRRGHGLYRASLSRVPGQTLGLVCQSGQWRRHDVALFLKASSWLPEVCALFGLYGGWCDARCLLPPRAKTSRMQCTSWRMYHSRRLPQDRLDSAFYLPTPSRHMREGTLIRKVLEWWSAVVVALWSWRGREARCFVSSPFRVEFLARRVICYRAVVVGVL